MQPMLRITLLGPAKSGKSYYLKSLEGSLEEASRYSYETTPGPWLNLATRSIEDQSYDLGLWEIGSSVPRDKKAREDILNSQLYASDQVLVFCDLSDEKSLEKIASEFSAQSLRRKCNNPATQFFLIGVHTDPSLTAKISDEQLENFAIKHKFDKGFDSKDSPADSFKIATQSALQARRLAIAEKIDQYGRRRITESFKSLIAYFAWALGLNHHFGHSTESDKIFAATALKTALSYSTRYLDELPQSARNALENGRLSTLYRQAAPFFRQKEPSLPPSIPEDESSLAKPTTRS